MSLKKIIHIDMDAFYASVEQRDNPNYRGKPLVVGGSPNQRGVVAAASYEARKFGIHSAMPSRIALAKCPHLIFAPPRFEVYRAISDQIHCIFRYYTDLVEPVALDEAYLDVTVNKPGLPYATTVARHIRAAIFAETNLTASAGVSVNKFLAKMASGKNKPNGMTVILPEDGESFVEALPIEKFHGIGEVTATKMHSLGIRTGADLKMQSHDFLTQHFGKAGNYYYKIARAEDDRVVEPNRIRKSIGAETSFAEDLSDMASILLELDQIAQVLKQRIDKHQASGRTLTLKVKFSNYQQITRSKTLLLPIKDLNDISVQAKALFAAIELCDTISVPLRGSKQRVASPKENGCQGHRSIRLLGISLSNLDNPKEPQVVQLLLFEETMRDLWSGVGDI